LPPASRRRFTFGASCQCLLPPASRRRFTFGASCQRLLRGGLHAHGRQHCPGARDDGRAHPVARVPREARRCYLQAAQRAAALRAPPSGGATRGGDRRR